MLFPKMYASFYVDRALSLVARVLTGGVFPLLSVAIYVFTALALHTMAKRRGIACPWLAWIPVANLWLIGSLSDQYRYLTRGQIKHRRIALLVLEIVTMVLSGAVVGVIVWVMGTNGSTASVLTLLAVILLDCAAAIALAVWKLMALYDIYASCDPQNAALYLVLSIFFRFLKPVFLFLSRNQELGMPPRKAPQPEPNSEDGTTYSDGSI